MSAGSYKKSFEQWWTFYFLKGLYGYSNEEMKEFSDYRPGSTEVEKEKYSWFRRAKKNAGDEDDIINYKGQDDNWDMSA